jgi:hypothetical protein
MGAARSTTAGKLPAATATCKRLLAAIRQTETTIRDQQAQFVFLQLRYTLRCLGNMPRADAYFSGVLRDVHTGKSLEDVATAHGQDTTEFLTRANARLNSDQRNMFALALRAAADNYDVDFSDSAGTVALGLLSPAQKIGLLTVALAVLLLAVGVGAMRDTDTDVLGQVPLLAGAALLFGQVPIRHRRTLQKLAAQAGSAMGSAVGLLQQVFAAPVSSVSLPPLPRGGRGGSNPATDSAADPPVLSLPLVQEAFRDAQHANK